MTSFRWLTCTFRLYPHPRISTATVQLITPYFTVFFKLCSPNCSSFQYHPTPFSHHQTQWFQPSCNFLLILCLSPLYLPPSQSKSSLVSVRCRVLGTPYFHLLPSLLLQGTPFTTSVGYALGKRRWAVATEVLYSFSLPQQPTLLCPLACIFTVNSAKDCPPFFFSCTAVNTTGSQYHLIFLLNIRKYFFTVRVTERWHRLPTEVVESSF